MILGTVEDFVVVFCLFEQIMGDAIQSSQFASEISDEISGGDPREIKTGNGYIVDRNLRYC